MRSAVSTSGSSLSIFWEEKRVISASSNDRQRRTPMTSSIVKPWSVGESLEYRAECRSSEAYTFSRSTRRRISNAATRAGEIGMECLGELLAQSLATGEMIAVHKVASCHSFPPLRLQLQ